jgi:hypothetical protein
MKLPILISKLDTKSPWLQLSCIRKIFLKMNGLIEVFTLSSLGISIILLLCEL